IEIPVDRLSGVYVDAIKITRLLRYQYLWIESLCIIQGCAEDWEREANKMAGVYSNAICNLS
ncbi:hypothetical protein BCR34DRAFT_443037, partial [Clohesyomyces aquaticus]